MTLIKVEQLPVIQAELAPDVAQLLRTLATDQDHVIATASRELEDLYRMTAVVSFLNDGDVAAFHENMFLAAAVRRRFLTCVERGMKADPVYLGATYDKSIYEALCAGELKVLDALVRSTLTTGADPRFDNAYYYYFALALRMLVLKATEPATEMLRTFDERRDGALEGYSRVAHGLLARDPSAFNEGLKLAVEERKAEIANDANVAVGEQWLSVECLALARLGRRYELPVTVADPLIPPELQAKPDVTFPDPASVFPPVPARFVEVPEELEPDFGE